MEVSHSYILETTSHPVLKEMYDLETEEKSLRSHKTLLLSSFHMLHPSFLAAMEMTPRSVLRYAFSWSVLTDVGGAYDV